MNVFILDQHLKLQVIFKIGGKKKKTGTKHKIGF